MCVSNHAAQGGENSRLSVKQDLKYFFLAEYLGFENLSLTETLRGVY